MVAFRRILILLTLFLIAFVATGEKYQRRIFFAAPIVLDLDDNGVNLIELKDSKAFFGIKNNGMRNKMAWVGKGDGFLVIDKNNNGRIDNVDEFFGKKDSSKTDVQELLQYDQNNNGNIEESDAVFAQLKVWQDADGDGRSSAQELTTLKQNNITYIDFSLAESLTINKPLADNVIKQEGYFYKGKSKLGLASVQFNVDLINTMSDDGGSSVVKLQTLLMPLSRGYGLVKPMHNAMTEDNVLFEMVAELDSLDQSQYKNIDQKVEAIIFRWAQAENINGMRGLLDAKKMDVLEKIYGGGKKWQDSAGGPNITTQEQLGLMTQAWQGLFFLIKNRLVVQGTFKEVFAGAKYSFLSDSIQFGSLTYEEVLNRIKVRHSAIDAKYQQDFLNQMESVLKNLAPGENLNGLDKTRVSQDLAQI